MTARMPWDLARKTALAVARPIPPAQVPLDRALGATLATPLRALAPLPADDMAAMDGYAVAGEGPWRVIGRILAGQDLPAFALRPGEAAEVATGAPVPAGAQAVLPYEEVVLPTRQPAPEAEPLPRGAAQVSGVVVVGRHIRRRGEGCPRGAELLPAGTPLTPVALGLAASVGHDALAVRRPAVSAIVTGDEVLTAGLPRAGRVRDAIGPVLPGLVRWAGGDCGPVTRVRDDPAALREAVVSAAKRGVHVVAVVGASSVGPADHLGGVLASLDAEILVDGVACRPGHPQVLARLPQGAFVVGLPGNPFAAVVAAQTLLVPLLAGLAGRPHRPGERARLAGSARPHPRDTRLLAVRGEHGRAVPVGHDRPGVLWGPALADALAVVPPGWDGEDVELVPLPR